MGRMRCDGESRYNKEQVQAGAGTRVKTRVRVKGQGQGLRAGAFTSWKDLRVRWCWVLGMKQVTALSDESAQNRAQA